MKKTKNSDQQWLWALSEPQGERIHYLLGTMHAHTRITGLLRQAVQPYISRCGSFAAEYDLNIGDQVLQINPLLPPELDLQQLLGKYFSKYRRVAKRSTGVDLLQLRQLRPLLVVTMLERQIVQQEGSDALDIQLWSYAQAQQRRMLGLESSYPQLDAMEQREELNLLRGFLRNISATRRRIHLMESRYERGAMRQLYLSMRAGMGRMRKPLLLHRNVTMSAAFYEFSREDSLFAAVGAAHLSGGKGMLRLLKQKGLRVAPVPLPGMG